MNPFRMQILFSTVPLIPLSRLFSKQNPLSGLSEPGHPCKYRIFSPLEQQAETIQKPLLWSFWAGLPMDSLYSFCCVIWCQNLQIPSPTLFAGKDCGDHDSGGPGRGGLLLRVHWQCQGTTETRSPNNARNEHTSFSPFKPLCCP